MKMFYTQLAVIINDGIRFYISLYDPTTGALSNWPINGIDESTKLFWSPDKTRLAAVGDSGIIYILDLKTKLVSSIDQTTLPPFVDWAPDSRRLVYSNGRIIRIYDVVSNNFRTLDVPNASYVQWFPDGFEILYEAKDESDFSQLYKINAFGNNNQKITQNSGSNFNEVRLSPDSSYILYTTPGVSVSIIYVIELDTGNTFEIPGGPEGKNYHPTWSPDSEKIAYSSTQYTNGNYNSQIRVCGPKGQDDRALAASNCFSTPVTWSPDCNMIGFLSGCGEDFTPKEVWSIDIHKMLPKNLLSGSRFYNLDWSQTR